jgi:hypothetical protein
MRKLTDLKGTLAENVLSIAATMHIKGGKGNAVEDEKRRQRPGGGISTNGGIAPTC